MSFWEIKKKTDKLVEAHEKRRVKNKVLPWWHRDDFVNRGQHSRDSKLEKQYWNNWRKLKDDKN